MQREGQALPLSIVRPPLSSRQRRERTDTPRRPLPPHPFLTPSARKGKRGEGNTARQSSPPTRRAARGEGRKSSPAPANSPSGPLCTPRQQQERGHDPQQPRPPPSLAPFTGRGKRGKHRSAVGSYASSGGKRHGGKLGLIASVGRPPPLQQQERASTTRRPPVLHPALTPSTGKGKRARPPDSQSPHPAGR